MWHEHGRELLAKVEQARRNWPKYWEQHTNGEPEHTALVDPGNPRKQDDSETSLAGSNPKQEREGFGLVI